MSAEMLERVKKDKNPLSMQSNGKREKITDAFC